MENNLREIIVTIKYERALKTYDSVANEEDKYFPPMSDGSLIVQKKSVGNISNFGENYGVIDIHGREIVPCIYDSCKPINENYYIVGKKYTSGGFNGDDYSYPEQQYGVVDTKGNELVPLKMKSIFYSGNLVSLYDFKDNYSVGLINESGKLDISDAYCQKLHGESLEDVYNIVSGTNKTAVVGKNIAIKREDYSNYQEFVEKYSDIVNQKNNNYGDKNSMSDESKGICR